ncbi:MAG: DUF6159 family protein [Kofleriaceae bacterium]
MRFEQRLDTGWSFLKAAFAMARENRKLLAPSLYQVLCTILYVVGWVVALVAIEPQWSEATWAIVSAIAVFGSFVIFYFFCGMTVHMVDVHLEGGTPSLGEAARDARKNFVAIAFLATVSTVIDLFTRAAREEAGLFGKIVASIVEAVWTMMSFLLLPAIIIEDISFGDAMRRVREIHKGNLLAIGVGEVGVRLVTNLVALVWFLAIVAVVYGSFALLGGTPAMVVSFVVGGAMFALFAAFSTYLRTAYYTCLYLWASEVAKAGHSVPAPLPLAIALGHTSVGRRAA